MDSADKQNEYFQDYNYFNNESGQSRDRNFFFTENSYVIDFKEPLSLCYSENNSIMGCQSPQKVQPTGITTKVSEKRQAYLSSEVPKPKQRGIQFEAASIDLYKTIYQGTKDDTVELNINFKTILVNYFKELILAKELNPTQIENVTAFMKRVPSFNSLKKVFEKTEENRKIRKLCLDLFSSSDCIKRVMTSRCKQTTKLQMIKFIQKIRLNILCGDRIIRWKDITKRQGSI